MMCSRVVTEDGRKRAEPAAGGFSSQRFSLHILVKNTPHLTVLIFSKIARQRRDIQFFECFRFRMIIQRMAGIKTFYGYFFTI